MRVAALYDIHGNLPALEAVLEDVRRADVDRLVVGGDVLPGPMPRESFARLKECGIPAQFIYGNCEVAVLEQLAGKVPAATPERFRPIIRWTAERLGPDDERWIASWPKTLRLDIPGIGATVFCHGTPRDENELFTRLTPDDRLLPIFDGLDARLVVCGHTHMQFDRTVGRTRIVNAGSVGMPFGERGAYWLLLGADVQLRRTMYDFDAAAEAIRRTDDDQVREFFVRYVVDPPSEQEMLEVYSRVGG